MSHSAESQTIGLATDDALEIKCWSILITMTLVLSIGMNFTDLKWIDQLILRYQP